MPISALPIHPVTGVRALGIGKRGPIWPIIGGSGDITPPDAGDKTGDGGSFEPIMSQDVLDHIIRDRLAREKAKYADYEALKAKADAYDAAEAEKLSEIQKAEKAARDAQEEAEKLRIQNLRLTIAGEKGVPAQLLSGTTREEIEASADVLLTWRGNAEPEKGGVTPNPQQGRQSNTKPSGRAAGAAEVEKRFGKKLN